jgi:hypothetical protein
MHKVKLISRGLYKNSKGKTIFRYAVSGSMDAMLAYEQAQGEYYYVSQDGDVMYYTAKFAGKTAVLNISADGKMFVDNSELDYQANVIKQLGGDLGQSLAEQIAKNLLSNNDDSGEETYKRKRIKTKDKGIDRSKAEDDGMRLDE